MRRGQHHFCLGLLAGVGLLAASGRAQNVAVAAGNDNAGATAEGPYKIVKTAQFMGDGAIHDVTADSDDRRLYVPRGSAVLVFDLDSLALVGTITNTQAHTVAVDVKSHHAFASSQPVAMWDTRTMVLIKKIPVSGTPDGLLCDAASERIVVLSHTAPNVTVIDARDGSLVGTVDLGGEPEQAQSDGQGKLYVELEDQDRIAVVDLNALKVAATYDLGGQGSGPEGLRLDALNQVLFVFCRKSATCVILRADNGRILDTLPIGTGTDDGGFNPETREAFSSQRDGTLTIIKEKSPTSFAVEQTVTTKPGARTCTLDTRKNQIVLITLDRSGIAAGASATLAGTAPPSAGGRPEARGSDRSGWLDILVAGSSPSPF